MANPALPNHLTPGGLIIQYLNNSWSRHLLKIISVLLLIYGLINLYDETIQLFFIIPNLPDIFKASRFSPQVFQNAYYRSLIVTATALVQTVYGFGLIVKSGQLDTRVHLIAASGTLIISFIILSGLPPLPLNFVSINHPPLIQDLLFGNSAPFN